MRRQVLPALALPTIPRKGTVNTWAPIWNGLVDSSIWEEPDHVFRVFMAMMSLKDADHIVRMDGYKLARRIHLPLEQVTDALKVLESPDTRRPDQEFDGRRVRKVEEGWLVLNGEKYRAMVQLEMRRATNRRAQAAYREKKKRVGGGPQAREREYVKIYNEQGPEAADRII